ncbi:MAG: putative acid--CoA ligase [Frankiales bacterium]|nr:putative acid--CoA ligase [Frankiales bacterium]
MTAWDLVGQRAAATPDDVMAIDPAGRTITFQELHDRALELAGRLAGEGVRPGTVVSWQLPTWIEGTVLCLALSRIGAVQNPLIPMLRHREVSHITRQAGTRFLVVPQTWRGFEHEAMAREIASATSGLTVLLADADGVRTSGPSVDLPAEPDEDGVRWLFYTSGTTSDPKGAKHLDAGLVHAAEALVSRVGVTRDDVMGQPAPLTHVGGVILTFVSLLTGCRLLLEDTFDPSRTPRVFRDATLIGTGTPFFQAYLGYNEAHPDERPLFPSVRAFLSGGAPKPVALDGQLRQRFGAGIVSGYGMTECPMLAWNAPTDSADVLARTEGRPVDGVDVRVVDGELCVRGPQLMQGYVDSSLDEDAFTDDGYLRTGDLVAVDDAGNITITGRVKDIIIRNMENISAREVEELLLTHPSVRDVAVIGLPDDETGERVCAVVVAEGPAPDLASLAAHFRSRGVSSRKLPAQLELVDELPRNAMLKVEKATLRRRFAVGVS